jgi:hypothetical protein
LEEQEEKKEKLKEKVSSSLKGKKTPSNDLLYTLNESPIQLSIPTIAGALCTRMWQPAQK